MHENDCQCILCRGRLTMAELKAKERAMLTKFGWYAHIVVGDPQSPTGVNYHTHGFEETLGHRDLQIVLPGMSKDQCHRLASELYSQIKGGRKFRNNSETTVLAEARGPGHSSYRVKFIEVKESGRLVLRVVLPTPDGYLEPKDVGDNDDPAYALQWTVT